MKQRFRFICRWFTLFSAVTALPLTSAAGWFEDLKATASDEQLYQLLYEMPKGGNLHTHMTGSGFSEWWYDLALAAREDGYSYYTKIRINNCRDYGDKEFAAYLLHFRNISANRYGQLGACEQGEYVPLESLDQQQKSAWLDSLRLDKPHEGRDEFFDAHWDRLGDLTANPYLQGDLIVRTFKAFAAEGLIYMEPQVSAAGYVRVDGTPIPPNEVAEMFRNRLREPDAIAIGMTYRFQQAILRFLPAAPEHLKFAYEFVSKTEPYVAVNMVGREDDDRGYPLRFLSTLRELRHRYNNVRLSIHAGEVDEPNYHVRDSLLLGADRIGHGINLISDPETMRLMRHGPYLVEINLISNLLLEYIDDYSQHPFPEYLRTGIPVALSTDDRGMWDSTMTDEFFVAVKEFNLSWAEIKLLGENSLRYAFVSDEVKADLLSTYRSRIGKFEKRLASRGIDGLKGNPAPKRHFICQRYEICMRYKSDDAR